MVASWAPPYPGASEKTNLVMMLGYAHGDHLRVKTTPFLMLKTMMTSAMSEPEDSASEDEAKEDDSARRMDESG
jgi:hypothetical protein